VAGANTSAAANPAFAKVFVTAREISAMLIVERSVPSWRLVNDSTARP
jgi:hypothetical protein